MSSNEAVHSGVENCRQNNNDVDFWFARDLQDHFGYKNWESFEKVILKAAANARNVDLSEDDHFRQVTKMVSIGSGATREISDYVLTRYAAYLVAVNADSSKPNVAYLKSYFITQARKMELIEQGVLDQERLENRDLLRVAEKALSALFYDRGLDGKQIAAARAKGDAAFFGGNSTQDMKDKYGITKSRSLSDFLPSVSIAAKTLVNEMTKLNVETNDSQGARAITIEHVQNNRSVRAMLGERGIKPEELPAAEDVTKVERRIASVQKKLTQERLGEVEAE